MTLDASGGLSIGTTTAAPSQGLLVQGATTFNSSDVRSQGYRIYKNGSDSVVTSFYQESISGTVYGNSMQMGASGDIQFWNYNSGWNKQLSIAITGAATFSSTLGINGVSDNIKSGTYTPTLSSIYNVASSTAFVCQYMRVGNVVTVSGVINVTATATNTWTRISMTLPISSNFDFSYRAGGGGGANSTNNVCVILAGASTSVVYLDAYPNSTNSLSYYFSYTYQII
jgi:hypothetical protein